MKNAAFGLMVITNASLKRVKFGKWEESCQKILHEMLFVNE
jgi:hypothetical protein